MASVNFYGRQFNSDIENQSFTFHNYHRQKEILDKKRKSYLFDSIIISVITGAIISLSMSNWLPIVILIVAIPGIVELLMVNRINSLIKDYEQHKELLIGIEKELRENILKPYFRRYYTPVQEEEHIPDLLNLINHKKGFNLSEQDLKTIIEIFKNERNIETLTQLLKNKKPITFEILSNCLIDMFPQFDFENIQKIETVTNLFIQYSKREPIKCDLNILKKEIKRQYMLRKASQFEEKLKRLSRNNFSFEEIEQMSGVEFEEFLANLYSKAGYKVTLTKKTGDQGADILVEKDRQTTAIQAKRYKGNVGNKAVQEIVSAMKFYDCDLAMVITTGNFTKGAVELAEYNGVRLIDGNNLDNLITSLLKKSSDE